MTARHFAALMFALGAALTAVVTTAPPAAACSCVGYSDQEAFDAADVVFSGALTARDERPATGGWSSTDPARFRFEVSGVFKGDALADQVVVTAMSGSSCGLEIRGPGPFLVFATKGSDGIVTAPLLPGELYANLCGGTRTMDGAPVPAGFGRANPPSTTAPLGTVSMSTDVIRPSGDDERSSGYVVVAVAGGGCLVAAVVTGIAASRNGPTRRSMF